MPFWVILWGRLENFGWYQILIVWIIQIRENFANTRKVMVLTGALERQSIQLLKGHTFERYTYRGSVTMAMSFISPFPIFSLHFLQEELPLLTLLVDFFHMVGKLALNCVKGGSGKGAMVGGQWEGENIEWWYLIIKDYSAVWDLDNISLWTGRTETFTFH